MNARAAACDSDRIIAELEKARKSRVPAERPVRVCPALALDDAYRLQDQWHRRHVAGGAAALPGYKIGLTDPAARRARSVNEPIRGRLHGPVLGDGAELRAGNFLSPRLEVELAFVMGRDLTPEEGNARAVLAATRRIFPAFEIIDNRTEMPPGVIDTVCDNGAFAAVVLGAEGRLAGDCGDGQAHAQIFEAGTLRETLTGAFSVTAAADAVAWLVRHLSTRDEVLKKGDLVLSGSCIAPIPLQAGMRCSVTFGALGMLSVTLEA